MAEATPTRANDAGDDAGGPRGSAPRSTVVEGVKYRRVGVAEWGSEPWGSAPALWSCDACGAVAVDLVRHAARHALDNLRRSPS